MFEDNPLTIEDHPAPGLDDHDGARGESEGINPAAKETGSGSRWTDEAVVRLKDLWDRQMSASEIARELNFTRNAVIGKAHRLGLASRPSPIKRGGPPKGQKLKFPSLSELEERMCRWPIEGQSAQELSFCGCETMTRGAPYCAAHSAIAYGTSRKAA